MAEVAARWSVGESPRGYMSIELGACGVQHRFAPHTAGRAGAIRELGGKPQCELAPGVPVMRRG